MVPEHPGAESSRPRAYAKAACVCCGSDGNYMPSARSWGCYESRPFRLAHRTPGAGLYMLMHVHVADAPRRAPSSMTPRRPPETDGGLLTILGPVEHEWHIVVVGNMGLDLMCTLLRAGAPRVAHLCLHERLQAEDTSLVGTHHQHRRDTPPTPISQVRCGAAKSVAHHPVRGATGSVRRNLADRTRAMPRAGVMSPFTRSAPAAARHLADVDLPERCNDGFIGFLAPLNDAPSDESRLAQRLNSASPKAKHSSRGIFPRAGRR